MSETRCPFCGLVPYEPAGAGRSPAECCEYGMLYFDAGKSFEEVKAIFVEVEGYEPPYKDTYLDNGKQP